MSDNLTAGEFIVRANQETDGKYVSPYTHP